MDYLVYVSHDAENLQFWLWLQDYTKRFFAAPKSEQALSPPWYQVEAPQPMRSDPNEPPRTSDKKAAAVSEFEVNFDNADPPPLSPVLSPQFDKQSFISGIASTARSAADSVEDANAQVGLKWQSCMLLPPLPSPSSQTNSPNSYGPTIPLRNQPCDNPLPRPQFPP